MVINNLPRELHRKGFDVLSVTHLDSELKKHLGIEFKRYSVFSVVNLTLTYKALSKEENFGVMIPCNLIVYEKDGVTVIGALRPTQFMQLVNNENLSQGASVIERKLNEVLERMSKLKIKEKDIAGTGHLQETKYERAVA